MPFQPLVRNDTQPNDPSPEQIAERAKEIRESWTDEEKRRRLGLSAVRHKMSLREEYVIDTTKLEPAEKQDE